MILVETIFPEIIKESSETDGNKKLYLKGIFMESEQRNRNGRIYKRSDIEKQVNLVNEAAKNNRHILGELDHPDTLIVKLENVSHKIVSMEMDNNNAIGKAEILTTPKGNIARSLIESGITIGVSSRGSGSVNESSGVVEDYNMITVDLVASPSANHAYPQSIYESLMRYGSRSTELEKLAEAINHDKDAQKYFAREIRKFIDTFGLKND